MYVASDTIRSNLYTKLENSYNRSLEFLMELCGIAKLSSPQIRHDLYDILYQDGVILLLDTLSKDSRKEKILEFLGELYSNILEISPFLLKNYLFLPNCSLGNVLLSHICTSLISSENIGTIQELGKLLRTLLEPDSNSYFDRILEIFYKELVPILLENLSKNHEIEITSEILIIFTYCIENHSERIKNLLTLSELLPINSKLMKESKHIAIFSLKLFKAAIMKKDSSINNFLIRMNFLDDIIQVFIDNSDKKGLLFSIVLSIFEQVKNSSMIILQHFVKTLLPLLKNKGLEAYLENIIEVYNKQKNNEES